MRNDFAFPECNARIFFASHRFCKLFVFPRKDVTFIENSSYYGGAIYGALYNINLLINESQFLSNSAQDSGGAIYMQYSPVVIQNSLLMNNISSKNGGAIFIYQSGLTADNNTFTGNSAVNGGAVIFQSVESPTVVRGNLFSENHASSRGGAATIVYTYSTNSVTIENNTFHANQADNGAALAISYRVSIKNNTFANNRSTNSSGAAASGILFSPPFTITFTNNILAYGIGGSECSQSSTGTTTISGSNNLVEDGSAPCSN